MKLFKKLFASFVVIAMWGQFAAVAAALDDLGWFQQDIGSVGLAGGGTYSGSTFTIRGSGGDIWDTTDAFHFVYQPWTNDVEITARVATQQNTDAWAKAGVMVRETLGASSKHAMMIVTPSSGSSFQRRLTTGGGTTLSAGSAVAAPYWMRLVRDGNKFLGYQSSDGASWVQVGSNTISMTSKVYVGLPVTAHNNAALNTCTVDGVSIHSLVPGALRISLIADNTKLRLTWTPNLDGQCSVLSSGDIAQPLSNWAVVTNVATQNGAMAVEIPLPATRTFFRTRYNLSAPVGPSALIATTASSSQINLAWTDNAINEAGFRIERKSGAGSFTQIATPAANAASYSDTGLAAKTTYTYRICATNSGGSSVYSSEVSATTLVVGFPITVGNYSFETPAVTDYQYNPGGASWSFNGAGISANHVGYTGSNADAPNGKQVAVIQGSGSFSQSISGFTAGYTYQLTFAAAQRNYIDQIGQAWRVTVGGNTIGSYAPPQSAISYTDYSAQFTPSSSAATIAFQGLNPNGGDNTVLIDNVRIVCIGQNTPALPSNFLAVPVSFSQIDLSWTDNANNETGFQIERKTGAGGFEQIAVTGPNVTSYPDIDLAPGTTYVYRIRAYNADSSSIYTMESTAATLALVDYAGNPFVTNPAPVLAFQRKLSPTLTGIDYAFPEQTAKGVALLSRFPAFTNSNSRIHVDGPWYNSMAANLHFSRGITSVGAIPAYRGSDSAPTTVRKIAPETKWELMCDPMWWSMALTLANQLESQNPSDPRIAPLRTFGNEHVYVEHEGAFRQLGYYGYHAERWAVDINGGFVRYPVLDIECTGNFQYQRACNGWVYQGMAQAAREMGKTIVPNIYGQWQFSVGTFWESTRQNGTGDPEYLKPEKDCMAYADPTMVACQENGGIISMDGYMQAIWGQEPFYKRNADNSLRLVNGLPVFNDITNSTAFGCPIYMEPTSKDEWNNTIPSESQHCLDNLYRQVTRMYLQHHYRAGQYPANSSLKKSFLSNCKIGAWERYSNEGMDNIHQNDRPVPGWLLDTLTAIYLFTADDITVWSSDMYFTPGPLGANYTSWRFNAHGVLEQIVRAAHRYSANDPLHASNATYQWCWFNLGLINQNKTAGDRYFEKPIAMGKLRSFEGHTYLELFIAWPTLDGTSKDFKVWVDQNGTRSRAYTAKVQNGRTYFYDAWQLPDSFTGLEGKHIQLRTTDLLGTQRTWCGDYRVNANNTIAAPADY